MPAFKQVSLLARLSPGTLAIFALSLLLHFFVLRATSIPGGGARSDAPSPSPPVIVELQRPVPAVVPPQKPASETKPASKPKPRRTEASTTRSAKPRPRPAPPPADPVIAAPATASSNYQVASGEPESAPSDGRENSGPQSDTAAKAVEPDPTQPTYTVSLPPSAELHYAVEAIRKDGSYYGSGTIRFLHQHGYYSVRGVAKLLFFSVLEFDSTGMADNFGLHPVRYTEKPFRREPSSTHFDRGQDLIRFTASSATFPRVGGEQDRASIVWQLAAIGRGDPAQLQAGRELTIFVAGIRDAEPWLLRVIGEDAIEVDGERVATVHVERLPRPGSYQQKLDIWLAPAMQWYPVKLRFTETNGDHLDMTLSDLPVETPLP